MEKAVAKARKLYNSATDHLAVLHSNGFKADPNGLTLFYHQYSIYSQKVLMAFYEKGLPFDERIINVTKGEQFSDWYLDLNPRGDLPLLRDGVKLIPDAGRIIDYLEIHYSQDNRSLIPKDADDKTKKKIMAFRQMLDTVPVGAITKGSFFHPNMCKNIKLPFLSPLRSIFVEAETNRANTLKEQAEKHASAADVLTRKAELQEKRCALLKEKVEYEKILLVVSNVLDEVEKELETHRNEPWLCGDTFTIADISLAVMLERLHEIGLSHRFWGPNRPAVAEYHKRVQKHPSFKRAVPSLSQHVAVIASIQSTTALVAGGILCSGLVLGATLGIIRRIYA